MIQFILEFLASHAAEIGTAAFTALLALLKRLLDKKGIRKGLLAHGMTPDDINKIV
jgi:hypothetical protein